MPEIRKKQIIFHQAILVMGPGQKILTRVGSIFCGSGQVGSSQPSMGLVLVWKISPKNVNFFNFFPFRIRSKSNRIKGGLASYLLQVKSKLGSGQGPRQN